MGRLRDTYQALLGRSTSAVEIARMKTEWAGLVLDYANLMDKLASMVGRLSKREARKATKRLEPTAAAKETAPAGASRWQRKAALRRRRMGGSDLVIPEPEIEEAPE